MHVKNTIKYLHLRTRNQLLAQGLVPTGAGKSCGRTATADERPSITTLRRHGQQPPAADQKIKVSVMLAHNITYMRFALLTLTRQGQERILKNIKKTGAQT